MTVWGMVLRAHAGLILSGWASQDALRGAASLVLCHGCHTHSLVRHEPAVHINAIGRHGILHLQQQRLGMAGAAVGQVLMGAGTRVGRGLSGRGISMIGR